jgi:hypothetical protein
MARIRLDAHIRTIVVIASSWIERSMLIFPQWASGSTYIHMEPIQDEMIFKLKKQVALTATLTKELDSTTEEVEFWQGKYKDAMKAI